MTALHWRFFLIDAESTVTLDIEGRELYSRSQPDRDGEACGDRVSCQHEHRGNSHSYASDAEENETDEMQTEIGQA